MTRIAMISFADREELEMDEKTSQLAALVWQCSSVQIFALVKTIGWSSFSLKKLYFHKHKTVLQIQLLLRQNVQGSISALTPDLLHLVIESCQSSVHEGQVNPPNFSRG